MSRTFCKPVFSGAAAKRIEWKPWITEKEHLRYRCSDAGEKDKDGAAFAASGSTVFGNNPLSDIKNAGRKRHSGQKGTAGISEQIPERLHRKRYSISIIGSSFNTKTKQVQL